ncbi:MAG: hypothetical protein V7K90_17695 [Nostoc sp.]|uniref:hypothetical protein n=1 Tax=Nostoc sp. TaxID=1180 RepID=UPI002FF78638
MTANFREKTGQTLVKNLSEIGCFIYERLLLIVPIYTINYEFRIIQSGLFYFDICIKINFVKNVQSQQAYFSSATIALDASHLEGDFLLPSDFFEKSRFGDKGVIDAVKIETYRRR